MKKQYRVAGPYSVLGHAPGESFAAELAHGEESIHLEAGTLELDGSEKPVKVKCPACVNEKVSRPKQFTDLDELRQHYADKHPALEPPDELPEPAEKEE